MTDSDTNKTEYTLSITFKSNQYPFSTIHRPVRPIETEAAAIKWRDGMIDGLGDCFLVTLLCDGKIVAQG